MSPLFIIIVTIALVAAANSKRYAHLKNYLFILIFILIGCFILNIPVPIILLLFLGIYLFMNHNKHLIKNFTIKPTDGNKILQEQPIERKSIDTSAVQPIVSKDNNTGGYIFALIILISIAATFFYAANKELQVNLRFLETTCLIQDHRIGTSSGNKGGKVYRSEYKLSYKVEGQTYNKWASADILGVYTSFIPTLKTDEIGHEYPCWYDPKMPSVIVLERGYSYFIIGVALIFIIFTFAFFAGVIKKLFKSKAYTDKLQYEPAKTDIDTLCDSSRSSGNDGSLISYPSRISNLYAKIFALGLLCCLFYLFFNNFQAEKKLAGAQVQQGIPASPAPKATGSNETSE
jgi:hypothetical protein